MFLPVRISRVDAGQAINLPPPLVGCSIALPAEQSQNGNWRGSRQKVQQSEAALKPQTDSSPPT